VPGRLIGQLSERALPFQSIPIRLPSARNDVAALVVVKLRFVSALPLPSRCLVTALLLGHPLLAQSLELPRHSRALEPL
jgi:hypothetical protein